MRHPRTRAARRLVRATYITRRRRVIQSWYRSSCALRPEDNPAWYTSSKWNFAHGCRLCKFEKYSRKEKRRRRRALDAEHGFEIAAWADAQQIPRG